MTIRIFFFRGGMDVLNDFGLSVLTHPGSVAYSGAVSLDLGLFTLPISQR